MIHYALIDAVNTPDLFEIIERYNPPVACLYNEPLEPEMKAVAPFLMELNQEVLKEWLAYHKEPWGICLTSDATLSELRKHLRKFTYAQIPIHETPVLFRYYDPRTIWDFVNTIDDWTLHTFLGPIDMISTLYEGEFRYDLFEERRKKYPKGASMGSSYLTLTEAQYAMLERLNEKKFIHELSEKMMDSVDPTLIDALRDSNKRLEPYFVKQEGVWFYVNDQFDAYRVLDDRLKGLMEIAEVRITETVFHEKTQHHYQAFFNPLTEKDSNIPKSSEALKQHIEQLAYDLYHFCYEQGITYKESIERLGNLLMIKSIFSFNQIPQSWLNELYQDEDSGEYRAQMLLHRLLG